MVEQFPGAASEGAIPQVPSVVGLRGVEACFPSPAAAAQAGLSVSQQGMGGCS